MYRKNKPDGVKMILKCRPELTQATDQIFVRSTSKILNLLQKSVKNHNEEIQNDSTSFGKEADNALQVEVDQSTNKENNKVIFNVVMGKKSTRKHKKWEDDGILEVTGKHAILKHTDGSIIHRTIVNPETLVEGFRMYIDNKEIEIIERIMSMSLPNPSSQQNVFEPPTKKLRTSICKQYPPLKSLQKGIILRCSPLLMPAVNVSKDWGENHTPKNEKEIYVDACLTNALRPHQRYGIVFLYECIMGLKVPNYFGAILADEMGLGKTLQCITIIWTLLKNGPYGQPVLKNVLIVTPSSLCNNWNKEFKHWLGFHRISPYVVSAKNKPKDYKKRGRNSVMIISYDMLIRYPEEIEEISFDLIVCDEGHRLKNSDIKVAKILNNFSCRRRILLTGTPIQNDLQEFFALIDFVNRGLLGNNNEFKSYYENPIIASQCPNAPLHITTLGAERSRELHEKTKFFVLRRTQETINKYLPSKHELIVFCRLSDEQEKLYLSVTDTWFNKSVLPNNNLPHLTVITTLKKICNHPELFYNERNEFVRSNFRTTNKVTNIGDASKISYCGKISIVRTLLRNLKKTNEKLVLVSYYTQTLNLLEGVCSSEGLEFYRLDGSTTNSTRSKIVERFNLKNNSTKVFLLSAKAGGVGLNLPGASRLILFDSDWNPASDFQAMARIWRDGQEKDVYILRLLTTGTIEEKIFQRQISKAGLSDTVVDVNRSASLKLSASELKDLFTLTTNTNCLTHDLMKCDCNGYKEAKEISEGSQEENKRIPQFYFQDKETEISNITINQLLSWEHYHQPVPHKIIQEVMLSDMSDNISFILKNSMFNKA